MKPVMFLLMGGWLVFGVGCASVPPVEKPVAAAPVAPSNNSRVAQAVKNWWDTPPPEVHQ